MLVKNGMANETAPDLKDEQKIKRAQYLQIIIEKLARQEISEEEALIMFKEIWNKAYSDEALRAVLRELIPSLSTKAK